MEHDVKPGHLDRCNVCGSSNLESVIDLGHQPLCDSLLSSAQLNEPETTYPLNVVRCLECTLVQLDYVVDPAVVFHRDYPYRTGITKELAEYQTGLGQELASRYALDAESLAVDIGSNDGTLLKALQGAGSRVLGVEPTDIATIARADGVETMQSFFSETVAGDIVSSHGCASLITASNVFAHVANLGDILRGILTLLDVDGVFVVETHYLLDVIAKTQYDTFYHEHIRTYSLRSLVRLFEPYGLEVVDAARVSRYGGNLRIHVARSGRVAPASAVREILQQENEFGLADAATFREFRDRVSESRNRLQELAVAAHRSGEPLVGKSCPGRCSTLLNYCGLDSMLMPYVAEQPTSLKLGLHVPGTRIPVVEDSVLLKDDPKQVVLLAWHYAEPIAAQLRAAGLTSQFITPLPECGLVDV